MFKFLNVKIVILCLCLILAGCGGEVQEESAVPAGVTDPRELTQSAFKKQEIGAYEEAIEILNRALEIDPQFASAHYRMGSVYEEWDKKNEAIASYKNVLEIDPENVNARLGLASVYSKLTMNERAIEEYKKVAKTMPADPEIPFKIALEYWYIQKLPETAEYYRKVIEIDPGNMQAHLNLVSVYERMKEWEKAIEEIDIARRLGRKNKDEQAISIAENKLKFIKGRMNLTAKDMKRKTEPPFD